MWIQKSTRSLLKLLWKSFDLPYWELLKYFWNISYRLFRERTFSEKSHFSPPLIWLRVRMVKFEFVCLYFCICVFLVFPCVIVFVFEAYLCICIIFRLHLLLTLLLSSPASIYRQTLAQCADSLPLPIYNQLSPAGRYLLAVFRSVHPIFLYWNEIIMNEITSTKINFLETSEKN